MAGGGTQKSTQDQTGSYYNTGFTGGTNTQSLDPASQSYLNYMRSRAQTGVAAGSQNVAGDMFTGPQTQSIQDQAAQFMNPYQKNVIDATQGQYDQLRAHASTDTAQQATLGGAMGGSRQALLQGARLGALDQGQASTISGLLNSGYENALSQGTAYAEHQRQLTEQKAQEPYWRAQQEQGILNAGLGPVGYNQTNSSNTDSSGNTRMNGTTVAPKQSGNIFGDILGVAQVALPFLSKSGGSGGGGKGGGGAPAPGGGLYAPPGVMV